MLTSVYLYQSFFLPIHFHSICGSSVLSLYVVFYTTSFALDLSQKSSPSMKFFTPLLFTCTYNFPCHFCFRVHFLSFLSNELLDIHEYYF